MKSIRLIQIGDIHWPQYKDFRVVDKKDKSFPPDVRDQVAIHPLQLSFRKIMKICQNQSDAILLCGDLSSHGNYKGYKECLSYLQEAVFSCFNEPYNSINAVPGNHDIDRKKCDTKGLDVFKKFKPLEKAWKDIGLPILPISKSRQTEINNGNGCNAKVFSMNSCIGCGEKRYLPEDIRNELWDLLKKYVSRQKADESFNLIGDKLDTPAIAEEEISEVCAEIEHDGSKIMSIILSHHNILPQTIPRIALYSELLNAGLIRSRLSSCGEPVIYCHGHIHNDPIEIINRADNKNSRLVCIAAPELKDGFNLLEIQYGAMDCAIGCIVKPWRIDDTLSVVQQEEIRIPLRTPKEKTKLGHNRLLEIEKWIPSDYIRFNELLLHIRKKLKSQIKDKTLAEILLESEWFGFLEIIGREEDKKHWHIKRLI